jgi:transglutaminase-like putative cysteine protease
MHFSVRHKTEYRYSAPVNFSPHIVRLTPRAEDARLLEHDLIVSPAPAHREDITDAFGNAVTRLTFEDASDHLRIESRFALETHPVTPPAESTLPPLPWSQAADAAPYYFSAGPEHETVRAFAGALASEHGGDALAFLEHLNRTLYTRIDRKIREEGAAQSAAHTLEIGRGACRDLAVLFIAACRSLGIPARFVSGYQAQIELADGRRHLHAWPEAFLPGLGWRGFDPTHGIMVSEGHVAICAGPEQAHTMPVEGGFYGNGITSTLDYAVEIDTGA